MASSEGELCNVPWYIPAQVMASYNSNQPPNVQGMSMLTIWRLGGTFIGEYPTLNSSGAC